MENKVRLSGGPHVSVKMRDEVLAEKTARHVPIGQVIEEAWNRGNKTAKHQKEMAAYMAAANKMKGIK